MPSRPQHLTADVLRRTVALLERVVPLAGRARRILLQGLAAALLAVTVIGFLLWDQLEPFTRQDIVLMLVLLVVLLIPAGVVLLASIALHEVTELPQRLLDLPDTTAESHERLRRIVQSARRNERSVHATLHALWDLGVLIATSRDVLQMYAPLVAVINPIFLITLAAASIAIVMEVVLAICLLVLTLIL